MGISELFRLKFLSQDSKKLKKKDKMCNFRSILQFWGPNYDLARVEPRFFVDCYKISGEVFRFTRISELFRLRFLSQDSKRFGEKDKMCNFRSVLQFWGPSYDLARVEPRFFVDYYKISGEVFRFTRISEFFRLKFLSQDSKK